MTSEALLPTPMLSSPVTCERLVAEADFSGALDGLRGAGSNAGIVVAETYCDAACRLPDCCRR